MEEEDAEEEDSEMKDDTTTKGLVFDSDQLQWLYQDLRTLGWLPNLLSRSIGHVLHEAMQQFTLQQIKGNYNEDGLLDTLMNWKDMVLLPWIQDLLGSEMSDPTQSLSHDWRSKLEYAIMESFCNARKTEIFDIIADYPDSSPAVRELGRILRKTRMQRAMGIALGEAFRHRLLHPGAQTNQILQVYMNSIKVLRVIDPTDALVDSVTGELTSYLRHRSDTVRCIITR
jgi:anaphase-promoting complex subunit 2